MKCKYTGFIWRKDPLLKMCRKTYWCSEWEHDWFWLMTARCGYHSGVGGGSGMIPGSAVRGNGLLEHGLRYCRYYNFECLRHMLPAQCPTPCVVQDGSTARADNIWLCRKIRAPQNCCET